MQNLQGIDQPTILLSIIPEEFDQFLKGWGAEAKRFKEQPGFISPQLHKGVGGSGTFVNYAVWESVAHFRKVVNVVMDPQDRLSAYPPSTGISSSIQEGCCSRNLHRLTESHQGLIFGNNIFRSSLNHIATWFCKLRVMFVSIPMNNVCFKIFPSYEL